MKEKFVRPDNYEIRHITYTEDGMARAQCNKNPDPVAHQQGINEVTKFLIDAADRIAARKGTN